MNTPRGRSPPRHPFVLGRCGRALGVLGVRGVLGALGILAFVSSNVGVEGAKKHSFDKNPLSCKAQDSKIQKKG